MSRVLSRSLHVLFNLHSRSYEVDFITPILQMKKIKAWGYERITPIHTVSKGWSQNETHIVGGSVPMKSHSCP